MDYEEVKICGDISFYSCRQESMIELNSLLLILKTKIWMSKSTITKKYDAGVQIESK